MSGGIISNVQVKSISPDELSKVKRSFTTRRVPQHDICSIICSDAAPKIGDLVFAVVDKIGSHPKIELPNGRRAALSAGDMILVVYGNRYAPDQFEAVMPRNLEACHLVAAGGIASTKISKHDSMANPTRITPIGLAGNRRGEVLNVSQYAVSLDTTRKDIAAVIVAGTAMNAGKTTTAASLVYALSTAGHKVAGIKATGTGAGGDVWLMSDKGAALTLDFTDAGLPSTYLAPGETIERNVLGLIGHAANLGCTTAVVEIADGLQHEETAAILQSSALLERACGVIFAANDALGAQAGVETLSRWGHKIIALSGQLTRSPLAIREASRCTALPVVTVGEIEAGALNSMIVHDRSPQGHRFSPLEADTCRRSLTSPALVTKHRASTTLAAAERPSL